jgi:ferric enterobactin receptor
MVRANRIVGLLLFLCIYLNTKGQDFISIQKTFKNTSLKEIFTTLKNDYNLIFAYDNGLVEGKKITADLPGLSIEESLTIILKGTGLTYRIIGNRQIVIKKADQELPSGNEKKFIHGKVYDQGEHSPLPYASVRVKKARSGAATDVNGYFHIPYHPSFKGDTLEIRYLGFQTYQVAIGEIPLQKLMTIELLPKPHSLQDVVISDGSKQTITVSDGASDIVLNPKKISSLSPMGEPDVLRALQNLPGISSNNESASELNIRGGFPDQNLILFDGITVYQPGHFYGVFSAFNAQATKDVQLYRGGFSAKYGGRTSGVLDITGKPGNPQKITGGLGLNLMNTNVFLETPLFNKKGALLLAGRRSFSDIIQSTFYRQLFDNIFQQGYIYNQKKRSSYDSLNLSTQPGFVFDDFNTKFTYQLSDKDLLSISAYSGSDLLTYQSSESVTPGVTTSTADTLLLKNRGLSTSWARQWSQKFYSKTLFAYSGFRQNHIYQFSREDSSGTGFWYQFPRENNLNSINLRSDYEWQIMPKHTVSFGAELTNYRVSYRDQWFGDLGQLLDDKDARSSYLLAGYIEDRIQPLKNWELSLGMRHHYYNKTDQNYFEPRVSVKGILTDKIKFKGAWTRHNQFISNIIEFNGLSVGENFWALADGDTIPVVHAEHFILGAAYETEDFLIDVEFYHKQTSGLVTYAYFLADNPQQDNLEILRTNLINGGNSVARGIDILLQKKQGAYTGWLGYSLSRVDVSFPDINQGNAFPASHDHRHRINWVNVYNFKKLELSLNWTYAAGKPFTDLVAQNTARTSGNEDLKVGLGQRNASRLPAYHRMDFSAIYHLTSANNSWRSKVGINIFNLYNRKNVRDFRYDIVTDPKRNQSQLVSRSRNLLGFSPTLFLNFEF